MGSSHYGNEFSEEQMKKFFDEFRNKDVGPLQQRFRDQQSNTAKKIFPEGKISEDDEGALAFRVTADKSKAIIIVDFGKPVVWLGLPKSEALGLIDLLKDCAESLP